MSRWSIWRSFLAALVVYSCGLAAEPASDGSLREQAAAALRRACDFYQEQAGAGGGNVWRYSSDLSVREGERPVDANTVWVQPPGTPSVGLALLDLYRGTRDPHYLQGARQAGLCLVRGQLESGGWDYQIELTPAQRATYRYRVDGPPSQGRNTTTLDDNTTQESLRLLMRLDAALDFSDAAIHEAARYALDRLLTAQYPNGGWPQRFTQPADAAQFPPLSASYPQTWSRTWPQEKYLSYYTLNDNSLRDVIEVLLEAANTYHQPRYRAAALRGGDFLILAQLPEPQPAWAQQYDAQMHPAWARKFEPPSVTGGESQGAIAILLQLYRETGETKYLKPIPRALDYLERSRLADGRLARFYELKTNRPLYFTKAYELTYSTDDLPTHYGFIVGNKLSALRREYDELKAARPTELRKAIAARVPKTSPALEEQVRRLLAELDERGAWVEDGKLKRPDAENVTRIIDARTFLANVRVLGQYLAATRPQ